MRQIGWETRSRGKVIVAAALCLWTVPVTPAAALQAEAVPPARTFASAQEAYRVGQAFVRSKNMKEGQAALEQALTLKPAAPLKTQVLQALLVPYATLEDVEPMVRTADLLIREAKAPAELLSARRSLLTYLAQKKKAAEVTPRYEMALKNQPADRTALIILSGLYADALKQPQRGGELTDTLLELLRREYRMNVPSGVLSEMARQYDRCNRHREAAALWEELAAASEHLRPFHYKEAAVAWLKAQDKEKALNLARTAVAGPAEMRTNLLAHFWHRHLGEVFLATGDYRLAIEQLEKAVAKAEVEGYKRECEKKLEEAKKALGV